MEAQQILSASFDDLVFEGRNKAYGAYLLRQGYHERLLKASCISLSSVVLLLGLGYAALQLRPEFLAQQAQAPAVITLTQVDLVPEIRIDKPPVPAKAQIAVGPQVPTQKLVQTRIVADHLAQEQDLPEQASLVAPGLADVAGELAEQVAPVTEAGEGMGGAPVSETEKPFDFVEQMPEYAEGGQTGILKYIAKHLRYPRQAVSERLEGMVLISFVVSASGEVTQATVLKDLGGGTGEEALRVISRMPRWKPGMQNHRPVAVRMTLPIRFKLAGT